MEIEAKNGLEVYGRIFTRTRQPNCVPFSMSNGAEPRSPVTVPIDGAT